LRNDIDVECKVCPLCNGEFKNKWWKCEENGHDNVSVYKTKCPICISEHHHGKRELLDVSKRPDIALLRDTGSDTNYEG
jgi:hypothetical protein